MSLLPDPQDQMLQRILSGDVQASQEQMSILLRQFLQANQIDPARRLQSFMRTKAINDDRSTVRQSDQAPPSPDPAQPPQPTLLEQIRERTQQAPDPAQAIRDELRKNFQGEGDRLSRDERFDLLKDKRRAINKQRQGQPQQRDGTLIASLEQQKRLRQQTTTPLKATSR